MERDRESGKKGGGRERNTMKEKRQGNKGEREKEITKGDFLQNHRLIILS